jgi:hypothetical protein
LKKQKSVSKPFRFLTHEELAALPRAEQIKYVALALEAIRSGHPLDDMPLKDGAL